MQAVVAYALLTFSVASALTVRGQNPPPVPEVPSKAGQVKHGARERISPSAFEKLKQEAAQERGKNMGSFRPADPIPPRRSLYERFVILAGKDSHTLIPAGSVLLLPEYHREHLVEKPRGNMVPWKEFLEANRNWLSTQEVSMKVARGKPTLLEPVLKQLGNEKRLVIATNLQRPVAIMHPVEEEVAPPKSDTQP